jgi:hypothetical protein
MIHRGRLTATWDGEFAVFLIGMRINNPVKEAQHLPAWRAFNQAVGTDGSVGIWHETYGVAPGTYENVYVNMPSFGLGKAGLLHPATGARQSAAHECRCGH